MSTLELLMGLEEEEILKIREKFIKKGRVSTPEIEKFPLDSLFIAQEEANGKKYLDSTEFYEPLYLKCFFCNKETERSDLKEWDGRDRICPECFEKKRRWKKGKCPVCKKEFERKVYCQKYCSQECSYIAQKRRGKSRKVHRPILLVPSLA